MTDTASREALLLRGLQILDELVTVPDRSILIVAESELGAELGLECTGRPGGWAEDGTVVAYDHNGETCPIHEWLEESDPASLKRRRDEE